MTKRMLIDTTHAEETRVVVLDGNRLDDYDVETSSKKQLKGNIYLAKIVRIEPSLQAAFVEYGANRHGFLAFSEIHPDYYQIPVADRERLIALQEEEARAEEARADHEDDAEPGEEGRGHDEASEPTGRTEQAALGIASEGPNTPPNGYAAPNGFNGDVTADGEEGSEDDGTVAREPSYPDDGDAGNGNGAADLAADPAHEPAPETVGGESVDDGQAQRRTARFLRQYKIQEVMRRRQILLIQVVKEERGNKGAALTTYISLAGRFCVLMPNSLRGGGVSRKITSAADRRRLKEITSELAIPRGMAMIVRTAGAQRPKPEIKRDCEYLLRTWDDIRDTTMRSIAPCLVYEEASLIKRAIRDVYTRDIEEIVVDGEAGWRGAREFMRTLMPANANKVNLWRDGAQTLFSHHQVEHHLDAMLQPTVQLRSGGYLVINQTEALVAIDVNSGRSTRERSVEETALRTNLEAADEVARQLRLRDLAGLIVIDFIDMEVKRNNAMVERRLKDALRNDRARIQVGSISHFGLMEMSRQRLRPSLAESSFVPCPHCGGSGFMRGIESSALHVLRAIEEEAGSRKAAEILVHVAQPVTLYVLNNKRAWLGEIEDRHAVTVRLAPDDSLIPPALRIDRLRPYVAPPLPAPAVTRSIPIEVGGPAAEPEDRWDEPAETPDVLVAPHGEATRPEPPAVPDQAVLDAEDAERRHKRRRRRRRGGRREDGTPMPEGSSQPGLDASDADDVPGEEGDDMPPSLQPHETLDTPSVFEIDMPGQAIMPLVATSASSGDATGADVPPAEGAVRGRRRRSGSRNRPRPVEAAPEAAAEPLQVQRPYNGPTPADPFAGSFDIFEMIERNAEEEVQALAPNPSASAASVVPAAEPMQPARSEPVEAAPAEPAAPVAGTAVPAVEMETTGPAAGPVETNAEPASDAAAPAAKPARVAKPRKPRPSRAKKPVAPPSEATAEPAPAQDEVVPVPAEAAVKPASTAPTSELEPEPEPVPDTISAETPAAAAGPDPSIVRPVVINDDGPAPVRRTGWWKR